MNWIIIEPVTLNIIELILCIIGLGLGTFLLILAIWLGFKD